MLKFAQNIITPDYSARFSSPKKPVIKIAIVATRKVLVALCATWEQLHFLKKRRTESHFDKGGVVYGEIAITRLKYDRPATRKLIGRGGGRVMERVTFCGK